MKKILIFLLLINGIANGQTGIPFDVGRLQKVPANSIIGNPNTTGVKNATFITLGANLSFTGNVLNATGGGGGGTPAGNYGNLQIMRNGVFATPASDSLGFTAASGLYVKNNVHTDGYFVAHNGVYSFLLSAEIFTHYALFSTPVKTSEVWDVGSASVIDPGGLWDAAQNIQIYPGSASVNGWLEIKQRAGQTNPIQKWITSTGTTTQEVLAGGGFNMIERTAPATPATNFVSLYAKSDGLWYGKDDAGVETKLSNDAGGGTAISALTAATATNTINNAALQQEWQWNTLASSAGLKLSSTSTAAAANTQNVFSVSLSGINATTTQTTYASRFSNTHTGTLSTNVALELVASGGTNNHALIVPASSGRVAIGRSDPSALFHVDGTEGAEDVTFDAIDVFSATASNILLSTGGGVGLGTDIIGKFSFAGAASPAQFTTNINDYNSLAANSTIFRISTDASRDLTGFTNGYTGRVIYIFNVGAFNLVIKDDNAGSTAANRFQLNADITLLPEEGQAFIYDATSSRWRALK